MNETQVFIFFWVVFSIPVVFFFAALYMAIMKYKQIKQFEMYQQMTPEQIQVELSKITHQTNRYKTSHLLHLFLSIFTCGLWIFMWILISVSNGSEVKRYEKLLDQVSSAREEG